MIDRERLIAYSRLTIGMALPAWIGWMALGPGRLDLGGKPVGGDFVTFAAAGQLASDGRAAEAWDVGALHAVQTAILGVEVQPLAWHYPPNALLGAAPLAWAPLELAVALFLAGTVAAYVAVVRGVHDDPQVVWPALAFPGLLQTVIQGQNGALTTALFGGGILLLRRHPFLAGVVLSLLAYKPHFVPLVGLALVAGRQGRAVAGALVGGLAQAALTLLAFGPAPWRAFVDNIPFATHVLEAGLVARFKMPTVAAALLELGVPVGGARAAQGAAALAAAAAVAWAWSRHRPEAARGTVLATGALLATPFAFDYDLALLILPLLWISTDARRPGDGVLLALGAVLPILGPAVAGSTGVSIAPVVILALGLRGLRIGDPPAGSVPSTRRSRDAVPSGGADG